MPNDSSSLMVRPRLHPTINVTMRTFYGCQELQKIPGHKVEGRDSRFNGAGDPDRNMVFVHL